MATEHRRTRRRPSSVEVLQLLPAPVLMPRPQRSQPRSQGPQAPPEIEQLAAIARELRRPDV